MSEFEKTLIREEDSILAAQLNDIIAHYENAKWAYAGAFEDFWMGWWQAIDAILPPLLPAEACRRDIHRRFVDETEVIQHYNKISKNRARREKEALKR
jgi:hypothetical protein